MRSKKQLAVELSKLRSIQGIDRKLEQYQTESELAADIIWDAFMQGDIEENSIFDLGCGNGIFGIGTLLMGAYECTFADKDEKAIEILNSNIEQYAGEVGESKVINKDVKEINFKDFAFNEKKKVVIMNPPFGTKKEHADKDFLNAAMSFADTIYSIHLEGSEQFLKNFSEENGFQIGFIKKYEFGIKKSHPKHKKKKLNVPVICVRMIRKEAI